MLNAKFQHLRRRKSKAVFEAIQNGDRSYEVCADTPDLCLDVGDIITFQEVDEAGNLTNRAFTKKILYKEPLVGLRRTFEAEQAGEDLAQQDYAILGLAEIRYRTLRSIYGYAVTLHLAVDTGGPGKEWRIFEGPFCAPLLGAPDLMELGALNGLHLDRWPTGRYSISLMARITDAVPNRPIKVDVIDLMVLTLVKDSSKEAVLGTLLFEELDSIAILDGRTVNLNGIAITPLPPDEIDAVLQLESELADRQYEQFYNETIMTTNNQESGVDHDQ